MDGSTIMRNLEEQFFGVGTSCIHGRFVQGEIWCKILRLNKQSAECKIPKLNKQSVHIEE